jgi:hypothetical protein
MVKLNIIFRYIALLSAIYLLTGCLGGTVAQQIVRSIATSVADKAMARALDVEEGPSNRKPDYASTSYAKTNNNTEAESQTNSVLQPYKPKNLEPESEESLAKRNLDNYNMVKRSIQETPPDPLMLAIANTAFQELKPIAEPLPTDEVAEVETRVNIMQGNQLVRVELFNLLIGDEKNAVYEQARLMGSTSLPQKREWALWQVGTGAIQPDKKLITFLIPPEFGKLPSGAVTMVELASPGELNVARYKAN